MIRILTTPGRIDGPTLAWLRGSCASADFADCTWVWAAPDAVVDGLDATTARARGLVEGVTDDPVATLRTVVASRSPRVVHATIRALGHGGPRDDAFEAEADLFYGLLQPTTVRTGTAVEARVPGEPRRAAGLRALDRAIRAVWDGPYSLDHHPGGALVVLGAPVLVSVSYRRGHAHAVAAVEHPEPGAPEPVGGPPEPEARGPKPRDSAPPDVAAPPDAGPRLTLELHGPIGHLVLDRPPDHRMDGAFFAELRALVDHVATLPLRGLVVRGRARHFSAGADLADLRARAGSVRPELARNTETLRRLERLPFPTVAAIGGVCLGSGLELALACRLRVAVPHAVLGLPEVEHGLLPGCGGTVRLVERVGGREATRLVLGAVRLDGAEALARGLVDAVVPRAELLLRAEAMLRKA